MYCLPVLDESPKITAEAVADIHLNQVGLLCSRILSDAARHVFLPTKFTDAKGISYDRIVLHDKEINLLPRLQDERFKPWVDWAASDGSRIWWLVHLAFFCDRERLHRFDLDEPNGPHFIRIDKWVKAKFASLFPRENGRLKWDFPIVLPKGTILISADPVTAYRRYYGSMSKDNFVRMKWTGRPRPAWMDEIVSSESKGSAIHKICTQCGVIDYDARQCSVSDCKEKKAYNL